ncbi:cohesin domain-containing protein [Paenibacillus chondroitinus]|uniref:Cohesin domain-containing protein n=1 Tax=Paenibacillus chondroitinus TaxID=59842 RepID=A0ABU6DDZ7_9BACL|nr:MULTISPECIES: immunoglobulin-like domain-containing protein [Paenibacillus]MCY9657303.1 cohesin domain-containing protein [Paenibacillus anseongense]MEB4795958.1 cohesin domain-containing protein [Paenibacillus chondroitinus]
MMRQLLNRWHVLICSLLMFCLLPNLTVQAAPGDLVNVALASNMTVKFSKENQPNETAVKLFDNNANTKWLGAQTTNVWVQVQFNYGDTQAVKKYAMVSANDAATRDPKNWRIEGSNDGLSWIVLDEQSNQSFSARFQTKEYTIAADKVKEYAYYRLFILNNSGESTNTQLADWKLFATELDDNTSVASAVAALDVGDTTALTKGVSLPATFRKGTSITWESSNPAVLSNTGKIVKRPDLGQPNAQLTLTATVKKGSLSQIKQFAVTVLAMREADYQYEAGVDFDSGFEAEDPAPTDTTGPANTYRILSLTKNIGEFCCGIGGMESKKGTGAHNGAAALQFSGNALNADQSYAYNQIFDTEIPVKASTTLSYWLFPEKESDVLSTLTRTTSKYVALDILFTDGTYLHDLGAKDQNGVVLHPNSQGKGGFVVEDQWNLITANLGEVANGKVIDKILFAFDSSGTVSGFFRGSVDDITIEHNSTVGEKDTLAVNAAKAALSLGDTSGVSHDLNLPVVGEQQTRITWESSNPLVMNDSGHIVSRPIQGEPSAELKLTATIIKGDSIATKVFQIKVLPMDDAEAVDLDKAALQLVNTSAVADHLTLVTKGKYRSTIAWHSSNSVVINDAGHVSRPDAGQPNAVVTLTATIMSGGVSADKPFILTVVAQGDMGDLAADKAVLELGSSNTVTGNVYLPSNGRFGSKIDWVSSNPDAISGTGQVHRPGVGQPDASVNLTATLTKGTNIEMKTFPLTVKAMSADEESVISAAAALDLGNTRSVVNNLFLPISINGSPEVVITWSSSDPGVIDFHGNIVRPCYGDPNVTAVLTARISRGTTSITKTFTITVAALGEVEKPLNDDATLSNITLNGEPMSGFDPNTAAYTVELPEGEVQVPTVAATTADSNATLVVTQADKLPGQATIVVRAEDRSTQKTYTIDFKIKESPAGNIAYLFGVDQVNSGATFDLTYDLHSVSQNVYAHDLIFTYDAAAVEFISAKSRQQDVFFVSTKETTGQVRVLAARIAADKDSLATGLINLQWKARPSALPVSTAISLSSVIISDGDGVETNVAGVAHPILINSVNKAGLHELIAQAQAAFDAAAEGTSVGQYPVGSKAVLQAAIVNAKAVADNAAASQSQVDQASSELNAALQAFLASINTQAPGDLNGDNHFSIGDLAMMAAYYGKNADDPNWLLYKKADLNNDGVIDIGDLAIVAKMILG